jgi:ATP-dependent Zn protease
VVIIASISRSSSQQNIGQQFGGAMNKTKNFEVTKNVKVKFSDVAGL